MTSSACLQIQRRAWLINFKACILRQHDTLVLVVDHLPKSQLSKGRDQMVKGQRTLGCLNNDLEDFD